MKRFITVICGFLLFVPFLLGQSDVDDYAKLISDVELRKHVYVLASDSCAGRGLGQDGIEVARKYIIDCFTDSRAVRPYFKESYLQAFPLVTPGRRITELQNKEKKFIEHKDYMYTGSYETYDTILELVFAGYGSKEDYEGLDVEGKAVFVLNDNLRAAFKSYDESKEYGAELCIVASPKHLEQFESISRQFSDYRKRVRYSLPSGTSEKDFFSNIDFRFLTLSTAGVDRLTGKSIRYWEKAEAGGDEVLDSISIEVFQYAPDTIIENNIVGIIPGNDTSKTLIIGAHYDHLGVVGEEIFYGADDNASGVAGVMELANAFSAAYENGFRPEKNLVFVAFSAEESGLLGSNYFVDKLSVENVDLMINLDMIGRAEVRGGQKSFYFIGDNLEESIYDRSKELSKKYKLRPDYSSGIDGSDQRPFAKKGVSTIFYFDGLNEDYHKTSDTPDKINYKRMERMCRMIFETVWEEAEIERK